MFQGFLSLLARVLARLCGTWMPGQPYAQGARASFRLGSLRQTNRMNPGTDRRFMDPGIDRFNRGFDRRLLAMRFRGFIPSLDPLFLDPHFRERLLDPRFREF
jgi:hypothetical protein